LLFAIGRRGLIDHRLGHVHPRNQTPSVAVLCIGLATVACMFLGDAVLVPISEVGSVVSAIGWLAACAAYYRMAPPAVERFVAAVGVLVGLLMIIMKIAPGIPGHFSAYEWLALAIWSLIGFSMSRRQEHVSMTSGVEN
jgi:amino acid transporter